MTNQPTWSAAAKVHAAIPTEEQGPACLPEAGPHLESGRGRVLDRPTTLEDDDSPEERSNTVEPRRSGLWIGVDAGHAVNVFAAHYGIPMARIPVAEPLRPATVRAHLAGNINEANDVFARDALLPALAEGDLLAFFPAGAYGASMASDHCLRGVPTEVLVG